MGNRQYKQNGQQADQTQAEKYQLTGKPSFISKVVFAPDENPVTDSYPQKYTKEHQQGREEALDRLKNHILSHIACS